MKDESEVHAPRRHDLETLGGLGAGGQAWGRSALPPHKSLIFHHSLGKKMDFDRKEFFEK